MVLPSPNSLRITSNQNVEFPRVVYGPSPLGVGSPRSRNVGCRWADELNMCSRTLYFAVSFFVKSIDALYWVLLIANIDPTVNYVYCPYLCIFAFLKDRKSGSLPATSRSCLSFCGCIVYTADNVVGHKQLTSTAVSC